MRFSDLLLFYARNGFVKAIRKSAYRKFCRRNRGLGAVVEINNGFNMKTVIGDSVDNLLFVYGAYEEGNSKIIQQLSKICGTFVDVGCNIGYYSCLYSRSNLAGKVYAIDPNPEMIRRTKENLDLNSFTNYKLLNFGVSYKSESLELFIPKNRHSTSSFAYNPSRDDPAMVDRIDVQVKTLGDILAGEDVNSPSLLKIDTEGFEYNVFSGLDSEKSLMFDYIVFEYSGKNLKAGGVEPANLVKLNIFSYYFLYMINDDGSLLRREKEDFSGIDEITGDYLLVKKDRAACLDFLP